MKTSDILLLAGAAAVLFVVVKKATAKPAGAASAAGGSPQPGVTYDTPTVKAAVVSGAVNGILNWISGTPKTSTPVNPASVLGAIDSAPAGDSPSIWSLDTWWKSDATDAASTTAQAGSQLADWASGDVGFA